MNRSMAYLGVGVIAAGFALAAYPLAVLGHEVLDLEQEAGFFLAPFGTVIVLLAAVSPDPRATTVRGTFGSAESAFAERVIARPRPQSGRRPFTPSDPVRCRYCTSIITPDLAQCPRCARARECRNCRRPLGLVLERATCPRCARPEAGCNCNWLSEGAVSAEVPYGTYEAG
jgi:hypothetical protein